jgi:hypothetical protein
MKNLKRFEGYIGLDNEDDFEDTSEYLSYVPYLKKVSGINFSEVIRWFNENDIENYGMSDLDMIIVYIERNATNSPLYKKKYE